MKYVFVLGMLASFHSHAVFQTIWKGYKTSSVERLRDLEQNAVKNALDVGLSENAWKFELGAGYDDTFLDALFSFNAQRTITNSYSLKLVKPTFRFGSFTFEHTQQRVDISHWENNIFNTSNVDQLYEARNTLAYAYDIFGGVLPLREDNLRAKYNFEAVQNDFEREQEYLEFYNAYLAAKLQVYQTKLAVEFRQRATKLKNVIYKRYKDGLSREAEYLQAKNAELDRLQAVQTSQSALKENLAIIENILGREIPEEYFAALKWDFESFNKWRRVIPKRENKSLEALEARIALVMADLERFETERGHRLTFNAAYTTNAFTEDIDNSFYQGDFVNPENDSKKVFLVYTIPLGMDYDRAEKEKLFIDKKRAKLQKERLQDELKLKEKVLNAQIKHYEQAFALAKDQAAVAGKRVRLQAKLYLRGLGTFDETIRAEQELLSARSSLYQNLYRYDSLLAAYALLNGSVEAFLNSYTD